MERMFQVLEMGMTGERETENSSRATARRTVSLAGEWHFAFDREDAGEAAEWFRRPLAERIRLPGSVQEQGYGDDVTAQTQWVSSLHDPYWFVRSEYRAYADGPQVKIPFLLQPKKHYVGVAWFSRTVEIPPQWEDRRVSVFLERPHWQTTVWLDGRRLGSQNSLSVPHTYDCADVTPGPHRLTIRVDNRNLLHIRADAHTVTDGMGGAWNGIAGRIELHATSPVWLKDIQAFPDVETGVARLHVRVGNQTGRPGKGTLSAGGVSASVEWGAAGGEADISLPFGEPVPQWDEFGARLQHVQVILTGEAADDSREVTFGFRAIRTVGNRFFVNGRRTHFRATHDSGCAPLTGYPATDVESWKRVIAVCQQHGLNMIRFHSWCPPEAAFEAADAMGFYIQPECGLWAPIHPESEISRWLYAESDRICRWYGNHPSFVLLTSGNEPSGAWYDVLPQWAHHCRVFDPRRLYGFCTGREAPVPREGMQAYDYWNRQSDEDFLTVIRVAWDGLRGPKQWDGLDYRRDVDHLRMPVMGHEVGQWCAYPNYEEIAKYTGVLRPGCYEIFRDSLRAHGLLNKARDFYRASGRLQLLCYKEEIEANLRTPGIGGFELLDLHDYSGQGMAFVGIRDMFWDAKEYAAPAEFRQFCARTVPLARFFRRTFTADETGVIPIDVYHYEKTPAEHAAVDWRVTDRQGRTVESGRFADVTLPLDGGIPVGAAVLDFSRYPVPGQFRLTVSLEGTEYQNGWDFWVYPSKASVQPADDILVTEHFDEKTRQTLRGGGKVLYFIADELSWDHPPLPFEPVFWNRQFKPVWDRTLGLLIHTAHPALAEFPTEFFQNWQWRDIIKPDCRAVDMAGLPSELEPIVEPIDDWNRNLKLGMVFECRMGPGRLMVCSAKLLGKQGDPAARQLLRSLLDYMAGDSFHPAVPVAENAIAALLTDRGIMAKLGATAQADAEETGFEAAKALTPDPRDFWMTPDTPYPHALTVTLAEPATIYGFWYMQQQNDYRCAGHIREYRLEAGDDAAHLRTIRQGILESQVAPGRVYFPHPVQARCVRLSALSNYRHSGRAVLALFSLITDPTDTQAASGGKAPDTPMPVCRSHAGGDLDDPTEE